MSEQTDVQRLKSEIEQLHAFFVDWFAGRCDADRVAFAAGFTAHLEPDFELITPEGQHLTRAVLEESIFAGHGNNPDFAIAIEGLRVRAVTDSHLIATYQEWQRGAKRSANPKNGRIATAIFRRREDAPNGVTWLHVHETAITSRSSVVS